MNSKKFEIKTLNYSLDTYLHKEINKIFLDSSFINYFLNKIIIPQNYNLTNYLLTYNFKQNEDYLKYQLYLKNLLIKKSYFSYLTNYFQFSFTTFINLQNLNLTKQQYLFLKSNFKYFEFFKKILEQFLFNHPNLNKYIITTTNNLYLENILKISKQNFKINTKNKLKFIDYDDLILNLDDLFNITSFNKTLPKLDLSILTNNYLQIKKQELKIKNSEFQQYLQIHIVQTTNNLFLIYIYQHKLYYKSMTAFGFKGKTKNSKYSFKTFFDYFYTKFITLTQTLNIIPLPTIIFLKNAILNTSIKTFLKKLNNSEFLQINSIYDITPQPYNGCKKKKIAIKKHNKAIVKYLSQIKIN